MDVDLTIFSSSLIKPLPHQLNVVLAYHFHQDIIPDRYNTFFLAGAEDEKSIPTAKELQNCGAMPKYLSK